MPSPLGLLADLTYTCSLHCAYCSDPLNLDDYRDELPTAQWQRVLAEARELGVLQLHLSGGEPLQRREVVEIVYSASELGLYTNLITSALRLSRCRAEQLREAGLNHVQISIQADEPTESDRLAGTPSFERKITAARLVKELGWPLTLNVVLHRQNIDNVADILRLAEELQADRVELANTQYYGWAWRNRRALLPNRPQLERAEVAVCECLKRRMEVIYVLPDCYSQYPNPYMDGWGRRQLTVAPNGDVLPCPAVHALPLPRASVHEDSLARIWAESDALPALPRNRLDARSLPKLRPSRDRLRRVPLPSVPAHRGCRPYRPGLRSLAGSRDRGRSGAGCQRAGAATRRSTHSPATSGPPVSIGISGHRLDRSASTTADAMSASAPP